jgi:ABC-type bacteriocin/lantibiotic exporter with double-glycine peptidase domain
MLLVPRRRQPSPVECLPTCLWSVLTYEGYAIAYEEILRACLLGPRGALLELAAQGLREAEWDIEVVTEFDLDALRTALADERPMVAAFFMGESGGEAYAHAVVVCGLDDEAISVMDPETGEYVRISIERFVRGDGRRFEQGLFIGGASRSPLRR